MSLDIQIIKEIEFPRFLTRELAERWADGIPLFPDKDPSNPEWKPTPIVEADLMPYGYGKVIIKDESSKTSNPTGTIKDRLGQEVAKLYAMFARSILLKEKNGLGKKGIETVEIPRVSIITSGNAGTAIASRLQHYGCPPVNILMDLRTPKDRIEISKRQYENLFLVDLSDELTPEEINKITKNTKCLDITSETIFRPHEVFYDWHVHEVFNLIPDYIFVPFGSGRIFENYLAWQEKSLRNELEARRDPRLIAPLEKVINANIMGAEPRRRVNSRADKLTKKCLPFRIFDDIDVTALRSFEFTGPDTKVYRVDEKKIEEAYELMN